MSVRLILDADARADNDNSSSNNNDNSSSNNNADNKTEISRNDNKNNQTIELLLEAEMQSTRSKRPARVSLEPTPTKRIRNPYYAKQYNNNNNNNDNKKSSKRQTNKNKQKQKNEEEREREEEEKQAAEPEEQEEESDEGIDTKAKVASDYCQMIKHDPNPFTNAKSNTEAYAKKVVRNHARFIKLVADATDPAKNDPGDAVLHEMLTKKVIMKYGIREDYLFYYHISGAKGLQSKTLVDQALKIWTTNIKKLGKWKDFELQIASHIQSAALLCFPCPGAVVKKDWTEKKAKDPALGTKRTKTQFDEFVDKKFKKVIGVGICNPYEDMSDLLKRIAMELGQQFGVRGKVELVFLHWKSHQLSLNNAEVSTNYPMVVEDTGNPNCIVKLIFYYHDHFCPDQVLFFCHVNHLRHKTAKYAFKPKSPVGADTIRKWVRDFAEVAGFKDWERYTPHDNRHRCCTILASDVNVPEKHTKSFHPYIHQNSKTQKTVQGVLLVDTNSNKSNNNNKLPFAPSTKQVIVDVDQQNKENIPVPQDPVPAIILGTKKPPPSKDSTLKKEVQKRKKDSKELKKENKKQQTKLQDAEEDVDRLTINLKASNNINKMLTAEKKKTDLEQRLEEQKDYIKKNSYNNNWKRLQQKKWQMDTNSTKWSGGMKKGGWKQTTETKLLAENKIKNKQRLRDIELKGKQNEIDQLHQQMKQNQCDIM
eukprot:jgi/Psemu1/27741/gm1.27741_g